MNYTDNETTNYILLKILIRTLHGNAIPTENELLFNRFISEFMRRGTL